MKTFLLSLFLFLGVFASSQITLHTDSAFLASTTSTVNFGRTAYDPSVIVISSNRDTVTVNDLAFVYDSDSLRYISGNDSVGLFYFTGLDGAFIFSVQYDDYVIFYQAGRLERLDGGWIFIKQF